MNSLPRPNTKDTQPLPPSIPKLQLQYSSIPAPKQPDDSQPDIINSLYGQLTSCISDLDSKVGMVLQRHEADFLNVYKGHMYNIQKEMRILKEKVSDEELKRKRDEELKTLEKERDWFRNEALRLDKICKEYKRNLEIWKNKAQILEEDRKFMENQIFIEKKKSLRIQEEMETQREMGLSIERSWGSARPQEKDSPPPAIEEKPSSKYLSTIKHLQNQIDTQKKSMKLQKAVHASYFLEKGTLEDFFIECVEEVKKEIKRRKAKNLPQSASRASINAKSMQKSNDEVELSEFMPVDKRRVVELIVGKDEVMRMLQELIFPRNIESKARPQTGRSHGLSHVFSSPGISGTRGLIRPSTAPKGWAKS